MACELEQNIKVVDVSYLTQENEELVAFAIDMPQINSIMDTSDLVISGWVIGNSSTVLQIEVLATNDELTNELIHVIDVNFRRPDVAEVYPLHGKAETSGFRHTINCSHLKSVQSLQLIAVFDNKNKLPIAQIKLQPLDESFRALMVEGDEIDQGYSQSLFSSMISDFPNVKQRKQKYSVLGCFFCNFEYKLAYLRIPKCACTTLEQWLASLHKNYSLHPNISIHSPEANRTYFDALTDDERKLSDFLTYTFVRDPYSRFISFYKDKIMGPRKEEHILQNLGQFGIVHSMPIDECAYALSEVEDCSQLDPHVAPQYLFCMRRGKLRLDFIGRLENFDKGMKVVSSYAGVKPTSSQLNKAKGGESKIVLSDKTKQYIQKFYKEDFQLFGYPL